MRFLFVAVCALLVPAAHACAGTVWTGTNYRIDASQPVPVGVALEAVTLTAVGLNGAKPHAFDGLGTQASPLTGITTSGDLLHQVWDGGPFGSPTPTLDFFVGGNTQYRAIDSHFLVLSSAILTSPGPPSGLPSESKHVGSAIEAPNGGFGNSLTAAFVPFEPATSSWSFAYLVVPSGATINLNFLIADGGLPQKPSELVSTSFTVVPEPPPLALLQAAGAALFAWGVARRRFQS